MAFRSSNLTNELVITAMDRFVWFILLIVMSHLVTEFTRVTGYTRGTRNDVVLLNDTENIAGRTVQNMLLYPGQENSVYDHQYQQQQHQPQQQQQQSSQFFNRFQAANTNNNQQQQQSSQYNTGTSSNNEQSFGFSFRPLIDSIFEIPISTLRAVNNLVARLTGSYRQAQTTTQGFVGKTSQAAAAAFGDVQKSAMPLVAAVQDLTVKPSTKKATMRELNA